MIEGDARIVEFCRRRMGEATARFGLVASEHTDFINSCRWAAAARNRFNYRALRNYDLALGLLPITDAARIMVELTHERPDLFR